MKTKMYSLTTLCLFFILQISAQISNPIVNINQIDLTLKVEDGLTSGQKFSLLAKDHHNVFHEQNFIFYNINLNYYSQYNITSYFALRCTFDEVHPIGNARVDDFPIFGATVPLIIPPVKKEKKGTNGQITSIAAYPYLVKIPYRILSKHYKVTIELLQYKSYEDYMAANQNFNVTTKKIIFLNATNEFPSGQTNNLTTYPNPSTNHLFIEQENTENKHPYIQNVPAEVIIYNTKGIKVSKHTLTNVSTDTAKVLYSLDTSQLPKGTYYFQISQGNKTQVKTIIKE